MRSVLVMASMLGLSAPTSAPGSSLRGSPSSMIRQHKVAEARDYTFTRSPSEVDRLTEMGLLVELPGNADYRLVRVSHPYARPQVRKLVERLAPEYHRVCGEPLTITSLTRPTAEQPGNAHKLSVHPAGMAVDLRISRSAKCRGWLERKLLELEARGEVDATREKRPPHYHIAVLARVVSAPPAPAGPAPTTVGPANAPGQAMAAERVPAADSASVPVQLPPDGAERAAVMAALAALMLLAWAYTGGARH